LAKHDGAIPLKAWLAMLGFCLDRRQVGSPVFSTIVRLAGHPTGMMNWRQYLKSTRSFHWSLGQGARSAAIEHLIVGRSFEGFRVGSGKRDIRKPQSLIAVSRVVALYLHVDA
jgi:hypothetical protein